jgi:hypothetical protein
MLLRYRPGNVDLELYNRNRLLNAVSDTLDQQSASRIFANYDFIFETFKKITLPFASMRRLNWLEREQSA